ncbi:hypothetical protein [Bradyrhizobium sp. dw_411]|uniref:hypothetical protein n=1 Tax=Bradyrhizobium sp. dw_411 TaxID=2720082 RepID=UPI001BCFCCC8|nr:hypothetical protein [Bradyrhizobium sp. dw_411]
MDKRGVIYFRVLPRFGKTNPCISPAQRIDVWLFRPERDIANDPQAAFPNYDPRIKDARPLPRREAR